VQLFRECQKVILKQTPGELHVIKIKFNSFVEEFWSMKLESKWEFFKKHLIPKLVLAVYNFLLANIAFKVIIEILMVPMKS
jgi:hypothetical protein